jgi:iron complex outermembrane receptor protein
MWKPHQPPKTLHVAIALAFSCAAHSVAAQQQRPEMDSAKGPARETISVTADPEKGFRAKYGQVGSFRDQDLLDIPLTINVVPRVVLDAQGAQGLYDAIRNTAGVTRSQLSGSIYDNLAIRGITTDNRTNFRLNGSLPVNNLIDLAIENKDRIEVLKGSSALYYGFTNPSGIVNMVTKRAQDTPTRMLALSGNEHGEITGHADIGQRFGASKQFGARVNVAAGRLRNAIDGFDGDRSLGAVALDWRATSELSLKFDLEAIDKTAVEQASIAVPAAVAGVITLPALPDPTRLISGRWAEYDANARNWLARADYSIGDNWALIAEAGRAQTDRDRWFSQLQGYNLMTGAGTLMIQRTVGQEFINKNARLEVAGRIDTGRIEHEVSFGYMRNDRSQNGIGAQVFRVPQNLYNPVVIAEPVLTQALAANPAEITDKGLYVFDRMHFGPRWQVILGVRRSDYENVNRTAPFNVKETSPSAGVIFKARPDTSIYYTYIEGLEEGGTAPSTAANAFTVLPAAVSEQHEVGFRTEALRGVLISGAFFDIERALAQLNSANIFALEGRARYRGFEFSASGEITPQLSIYGSALFLDAEQTSAANAALIGKMPENTPKRSGSLFVEYRPAPAFAVNAGLFHTSQRAVNPLNQGFIEGYTLFTAGARYTTKIGVTRVTFQLNVENLADKEYWSATGTGNLAVGLPRTTRLTARFEF